MDIKRQKEVVEAFHYDFKLKEQKIETNLKASFSPLKETNKNYPKEDSIVGTRLEFTIVFGTYVLSGSVIQLNHIFNRKINDQNDITQEEMDEIIAPCYLIL